MSRELRTQPSSATYINPSDGQRIASDPNVSSWVGASAGSGKTKVLTDRMLRLLLPREDGRPGTPPQKILALTFTKTAANEMALRLTARLSKWATYTDADLRKDMDDRLLGRVPTGQEITAARKLFAKVVDTPGGLKIMTIHSFCQSVLGRFPVEAGLSPHFKPLEEGQAAGLLQDAADHVLARGLSGNPAAPLAQAIQTAGRIMNEEQFASLLKTMSGERRQIQDILARTFGTDGLYTGLCTLLGISPGLTEQTALLAFCSDEAAERKMRSVCPALAAGKTKTDASLAGGIQAFWDAPRDERALLYPEYALLFLKQDNTVRVLKGLAAKDETVGAILGEEALRLLSFAATYRAVVCASATRDIFVLASAVLDEYQKLKDERGGLDFDDLILKTLSLLKGTIETRNGPRPVSPWVHYKLDEGLDHILVDEAQDTNPEQWEIIRLLSGEFFTGLGQSEDNTRTMFVVGDEKQSIFSFQRAEREKFGDMFKWFEKTIRESGQLFRPVNISTSFRSVQIILDAVDHVFGQAPAVSALTENYLKHSAHRKEQAGLVELWPVFESRSTADTDDESESTPASDAGWTLPTSVVESRSGSIQMAEKIGDMIQKWLHKDSTEILPSYNRRIKAGDIMILVRSRNAFVSQLVRELKHRNVPVSGVDRMVLGEQLVVQDLCAAATFALLPDDDLTLATLLKTPFVGTDEEELLRYAHPREDRLWASVKKLAPRKTIAWLEDLIARAGEDHPYEFFSRLIQEPCPADPISGLRAIRKRLGADALDPLDEFLNTALSYEEAHTAGLQGFLKWQERDSSEIKRQLEEAGDAVRIMTVHGAKGLQAPIVILPDTIRTGGAARPDRILWPHKTGLDLPIYAATKDSAPQLALDALAGIQNKQDDEYRRLLYVAMTRAEERLYIGGYTGKRKPSEEENAVYWYKDIRRAFEAHAQETGNSVQRIPEGKNARGEPQYTLRIESAKSAAPDKVESRTEKQREDHPLPDFFLKPAPQEPFPPQPLVPSRPSDSEPATASPLAAKTDVNRFKRGTITHKLLQILPGLPVEQRRHAAGKFLKRSALGLSEELQQSIATETMAILDDPIFAPIFGEGSLAEVPVTGLLEDNTLISGQIDRLLVTDAEILIVDFKTNRPPPQKAEDVPALYHRQLKAYADALRKIYNGRKVRAALLWTDGARLMEIMV